MPVHLGTPHLPGDILPLKDGILSSIIHGGLVMVISILGPRR